MATKEDVEKFKTAFVVTFGKWPDEWSSAKEEATAKEIYRQLLSMIDSVGINACVKAIDSYEFNGKNKPTFKQIKRLCFSGFSGRGANHSCVMCNGYDFVQCFVNSKGEIVDGRGLPFFFVHSDALVKLYPCPACLSERYARKQALSRVVAENSIPYAERIGNPMQSAVSDDDIPV